MGVSAKAQPGGASFGKGIARKCSAPRSNGLVNYAGEVAINQFLSQFNNLFSFENITYILSPIASINPFYSFNDRIKDVKARLAEKVGGIFEEFTNIE